MNFKRLMLVLSVVVIALVIAFSWGCEKSQPTSPQLEGINQPGVKTRQECSVNLNSQMQYIDGFGASTAWHGQISDAEANASFSNGNNQLGLTILRIRIDPGESWGDELANAQKARARGAKILATPWTPPLSMKTNGSAVGGELKTSDYGNYASWLNSFRSYMSSNGAAVDVISIQNEPNITVDYESCDWNPTQLLNFCRDYAQNIGGNVMMPEAYNFDVSYSDPTLNNSTAASHISHIGGHLYGANPFRYSNAINKGKSVWMTEIYFDGNDIGTALTFGKEILDCMANDMNAYVYWYLRQPNCNLINSGGSINKKGYVMAQFSKFIRPGYHRVDATYNPTSGIYVTAFTGSGNAVIVAINQNGSSSSITLSFSGNTVSNITKWETSNSNNLREIGTYSGGSSLTNSLAGNSISTFVGTIGGGSTTTSTTTTTTSGGYTTTTTSGGGGGSNSIVIRARGTNGSEHIYCSVGGNQIGSWTLSTSMSNYSASTNNTGGINVYFDNDGTNRDVQIDYITVNGSTRQAENQSTNTGVWQNSQCGGSNSEWLHCNGYIGFGDVSGGGTTTTTTSGGSTSTTTTTSGGYTTTTTSGGGGSNSIVVRARGTNGDEHINLTVGGSQIGSWTLSTSMNNYSASTNNTGGINVVFDNDGTNRDVQVDYITVNGSTRQAENQGTNTAVWQDGSCGGSNSEWMHCNGYIGFGDVGGGGTTTTSGGGGGSNVNYTLRARSTDGRGQVNLRTDNNTIATWTLGSSMSNYNASSYNTGDISVEFFNDATDRDVQIDYLEVNGDRRQAEDMPYNSAVWEDGSCGGDYSEWMHCNGVIGFYNTP